MPEHSPTPRPDDEHAAGAPPTSSTASSTTTTTPAPPAKSGLNLSLSQVAGGSLAAATAALLGSKLGTTGTIVGAALVSVVTAVGGALYTASLRRTREVVVRTKEMLPTGQWRTVSLPHVQDQPDGSSADVAEADAGGPAAEDGGTHGSLWSRIHWKPVALVAVVVFVVAGALVTGAQLATGNQTTVNRVVHGGGSSDDEPTPSPTPSQGPTDDTSDSSSPSSGSSDEPSQQPSESPSGSTTPSGAPTGSTTPSGTPTGKPTSSSTPRKQSGPIDGGRASQAP